MGEIISKGKKGGRRLFWNFETYSKYFWVADEEQKKLLLGELICNIETSTRYPWVTDEEQKKGLRCFRRAIAFLNSLKGAIWIKSFGNPDL